MRVGGQTREKKGGGRGTERMRESERERESKREREKVRLSENRARAKKSERA